MQQYPGAMDLLIRRMTWEAENVLSLDLVRPEGGALPTWTYGAHVDVIMAPDIIRQYSLCSDPADSDEWKIAVLREPQSSGGSRYVHESLRPGMTLAVAQPRNNFALVDAPGYLFIAGGIGVTPLLPMVLSKASSAASCQLLYGGRHRSSMAFLDQLEPLGERVTIWPENEHGLLDLPGAIERAGEEAAIYCCGPEPLIAAVEARCAAIGRPAPHVERFSARPGHAAELEEAVDTEFEIVLARSGTRLTVPIGSTIIEVLDRARVFVPVSCTEGYCGTCETRVIEGIPDHRDDYLTPEKRETNTTMMVCVGRSKTPELILDL